jgi:hypothetical protein
MRAAKRRVVVYLDPTDHRKLKALAALEGTDVSKWVRAKVKCDLDKMEEKGGPR